MLTLTNKLWTFIMSNSLNFYKHSSSDWETMNFFIQFLCEKKLLETYTLLDSKFHQYLVRKRKGVLFRFYFNRRKKRNLLVKMSTPACNKGISVNITRRTSLIVLNVENVLIKNGNWTPKEKLLRIPPWAL